MADTIKTNLGPVTAYADAKAHGYTGTREEFGQLLAGAAGNLRDAVSAKEGAEAAKQAAETAKQAAEISQKAAETAKANADTAASNAAANATAAANSAADAKNTLESIPDDYSTLSGKVDDNTSGINELKEDLADKVPKKDYAPETKTESMTQPVGKDENGKLWTTPVPDKVSAFENDAGYLTAHQDISGKLDADKLPEAVNDALAQAKASGEFDGADGITPHIGDNGNWYLGNTDTAVKAAGSDGRDGADGQPGADGKSAYQYAVEGGYTGAEAEFSAKMAQEQLTGTTDELTPTQVYNAVSAGIPVKVQYLYDTYGLLSFTTFNVAESLNVIVSEIIAYGNGVYMLCELYGYKSSNAWGFNIATLAQKTDIPSALPNPNALTFTGAVTGTYDGSEPLSVQIPSAVTDDHINSLIETKLGVIENGSY